MAPRCSTKVLSSVCKDKKAVVYLMERRHGLDRLPLGMNEQIDNTFYKTRPCLDRVMKM